MKFAKTLAIAGLLAGLGINSGVAFAKRDQRDGFNFGTSIRLITNNDRSYGDASSGIDGSTKTDSQAYSPFIGYSTGLFNLGLTAHLASENTATRETNKSTGQILERNSSSDLKGTSVFGRFLFGKVMFMEFGLGIYQQKTQVNNQYTNMGGNGSFNGQVDAYTVESAGPGYHMGGGLELPIANGFYFTSSYLVRIFQLRDISDGSLGVKRAYQQKRELTFGIEHYLN
ncbi:MAG: hypothetical protein RIQ81_1028 [Pseudomonadota bacterium]|jgi:hypothetical protein